jgi:hypothetical protein
LTQSSPAPGQHSVTISWGRSADDGDGDHDVERYAIFRKLATATENGEPIASIPAQPTASGYTFTDPNAVAGERYQYGVAVQDCTPKMSDIAMSAPITIATP